MRKLRRSDLEFFIFNFQFFIKIWPRHRRKGIETENLSPYIDPLTSIVRDPVTAERGSKHNINPGKSNPG